MTTRTRYLLLPERLTARDWFRQFAPRMGADIRRRSSRRTSFGGKLGRAGEQWALEYEQHRLLKAGMGELFSRVDWVADRLGDGAGYDILSFDSALEPRYIEVKTTNGAHASSFIISRNELDFSREVEEAFYLYRLFQFREAPSMYFLRGDLSKQLHLEPLDYRASFRKLLA